VPGASGCRGACGVLHIDVLVADHTLADSDEHGSAAQIGSAAATGSLHVTPGGSTASPSLGAPRSGGGPGSLVLLAAGALRLLAAGAHRPHVASQKPPSTIQLSSQLPHVLRCAHE
jgi:hypothetical protein